MADEKTRSEWVARDFRDAHRSCCFTTEFEAAGGEDSTVTAR